MSFAEVGWLALLLGALACVLAILLATQLRQRQQLLRWLNAPDSEIPDGSGIWRDIFSRLHRLRKEDGRLRQTISSSLDRFHLAAQALPDGVVLLDREGHIEWLNRAASEHFGFDPSRDIGTLIGQLIRQSDFREFYSNFKAGLPIQPLILSVGAEGTCQVYSIMLLAFADSGVMLLSRDISEIARVENMRRDFIANVSHELRTPLTVISGFLEQLNDPDGPADPSIRGFLTLMAEQSQRMNRLVEDLLTLSRLENTVDPPRGDRVDVPALIDVLLAEARALSCGRHVIDASAVVPLCLSGSTDEIRSAFGNLVTNAIRYTPAGGHIDISWRDQDGYLCFAVKDDGIGIMPEHLPRLTERFYRVDKGRSAATGGTGLGLAIVKHVLARHQGTLHVESVVGQGSTFAARLPLERRLTC